MRAGRSVGAVVAIATVGASVALGAQQPVVVRPGLTLDEPVGEAKGWTQRVQVSRSIR
jgi:hypothetical protein